jgi:hypothetical protein
MDAAAVGKATGSLAVVITAETAANSQVPRSKQQGITSNAGWNFYNRLAWTAPEYSQRDGKTHYLEYDLLANMNISRRHL